MIYTQLFFHGDARTPEGIRVGSLLFGKSPDGWIYNHYLVRREIEHAKTRTANQYMRAMLDELDRYVSRNIESTEVDDDSTEIQVYNKFVNQFGYNLRLSEPRPWPGDSLAKFIFEGSRVGAETISVGREPVPA